MPIPTGTQPARRTLLRDQIYDRLLDAVVKGDLKPGAALVDTELESWLGASRTPIREAISRLSNIGLIEVIPQKGTRVAELDLTQYKQVIETLGALDVAVIKEATPLLTDKDRSELRKLKTAIDRQTGSVAKRTDDVFRLFRIFLDRYGNRTTERLLERYTPHLQRVLNHLGNDLDTSVGVPILHALIDAALDADADAASAAASTYFTEALLPYADALATQTKGA